jgi:hypothetical protein
VNADNVQKGEGRTREKLREKIGVSSLSELKENKTAQRLFRELKSNYEKELEL